MRNLRRNKQTLYYALYKGRETVYKLDENGKKIISWTDESVDPPINYYEEIGEKDVYDEFAELKGNIALSGGDSQTVEFGVSLGNYEAVLITEKDKYPITETSLIWYTSKPMLDASGNTDSSNADYRVIKVSPSLNETKYILAKVVK